MSKTCPTAVNRTTGHAKVGTEDTKWYHTAYNAQNGARKQGACRSSPAAWYVARAYLGGIDDAVGEQLAVGADVVGAVVARVAGAAGRLAQHGGAVLRLSNGAGAQRLVLGVDLCPVTPPPF